MPSKHLRLTDEPQNIFDLWNWVAGESYPIQNTGRLVASIFEGSNRPTATEMANAERIAPNATRTVIPAGGESVWVFSVESAEAGLYAALSGWGPP